ncbi:ABC transporter ATP-binding protein [Herbaspirillum rubrisubalbicans]|uniref:ABC transporter ATP-binding protein n=1 Tax=Herbaspirillum rubrisubalbicans TaxID=80842 RepID=A0ABX9C400_9BURK|nr:ABC transporter ATP-binding protein [Herbaspirillum rubrisubalbicans]RAM65092.1 ABC transporter ATP-binding protein [Herbaspirillum rubrisubalbicans]RAN48261.1 ABC transporter ATP-binding protein [Herbaspirillum rubrisubalbicans]
MAAISLQGVCKQWGEAQGVKGIDFEVKSGDFTVLLGPSGCGKSTTLRLIAGLDKPTSGSIHIGGQDVTQLPPAQRKISMVFQSYALFPHLNVRDNILFGVRVRKEPRTGYEARLKRVADILGLTHLLERRPAQLSGGQQQRVALGRAIIADAPVCLMDEPLSNLDAQLRQEMRREIRALQQQLKITMIYVTHDQTEAMSMADQVILLREGRIEQDAPPADLYAQPATTFAARFIGTPPMNLLPLEAHAEGLSIPGSEVILKGLGQTPLHLGLRPEHIRLADAGVPAVVDNVEYFGADTIVAARIGAAPLLVRAPGQHKLRAGQAIQLAWLAEDQYFFERHSGLRRP